MAFYNLDKLISIEVVDLYPARFYEHKKEKSFLGIVLKREGFYSRFISEMYLGLDVPRNHIFKKGKLYEAPECKMNFQGRNTVTKFFKTVEAAETYREQIKTKKGYIEL